ncbi:MAG: DNA polymerase III subunit chi [Immundisolibacteraceae bacterium]|nr:DNA polymerase III subunit chi [Immundisolibacteraceae bacterium]
MTKVDFYVIEEPSNSEMLHFVCRLIEKIYRLGHQIHLHTTDANTTQNIDKLLWEYDDLAFLPHRVMSTPQSNDASDKAAESAITIAENFDPQHCEDVLINLGNQVPVWFSRFNRVTEFVGGDESQREAARQRYRFYRDRGYNLDMHQIKSRTTADATS